jgi:hypothetical protein
LKLQISSIEFLKTRRELYPTKSEGMKTADRKYSFSSISNTLWSSEGDESEIFSLLLQKWIQTEIKQKN